MYGAARDQRCWVHKTANVLNKLPKGLQAKAQQQLHAISMAETRHAAEAAFDAFVDAYAAEHWKWSGPRFEQTDGIRDEGGRRIPLGRVLVLHRRGVGEGRAGQRAAVVAPIAAPAIGARSARPRGVTPDGH